MAEPMDLVKGTVDMLILRALSHETMHGYGVSQWIRERTGGALALQDAALYQALRRLEEKRLVRAEWGLSENNRRARFYTVTRSGTQRLNREAADWSRYVTAVSRVLSPLGQEG
jgi:PadR family transcriptional regulator, regulatory protein PadR